MEKRSNPDTYHFVDSSSDAGIPTGRDVRQLIRRQAMSRVAAIRRQEGSWGQHNRRQYPVFHHGSEEQAEVKDDSPASRSISAVSSPQEQGSTPATMARIVIPASISCTGYESMRIDYGFDLLDVSALTTFHTGRVTARLLSSEPLRLIHVLRCRQWSYFSFLPSRYGHNASMDKAAQCVAARLRQWMKSPSDTPDNKVTSALNDPILCLEPETLCATAILAIYELLNDSDGQAWVRHVAGASALMRLRGPLCYQTDFEKAIFLSQAGPLYTEALLNDDPCFLEQDKWQDVFRSVVAETETLSDTSGIVVSLWNIICRIPSLYKDVQTLICDSIDTGFRNIGDLCAHIRGTRTLLLHWRREYDELSLSRQPPEHPENGKQYETLGIYMANQIIVNRLSVSLDLRAGSHLENETQDLACRILELERRANAENPRASLFIAFKVIAAKAALDTKDEWQRAITRAIEDRTQANLLVSSQIFEHWISLKGRKITGIERSQQIRTITTI